MKRITAILLAVVLLFSISSTAFACDEQQTDSYVTQILFGDHALSQSSDSKVKMLLAALYLCSEQCDQQGQSKIDFLKKQKVRGVPALASLNVSSTELFTCSHNQWDDGFGGAEKTARKTLLRNTVNKVFNFGLINNLFRSDSGKCDSFAAFLYYSHILADYLEDDPAETEVKIKGKRIPDYSGQPYTTINNNKPAFTMDQKTCIESYISYMPLDSSLRATGAYGCIGPDVIASRVDRDKNKQKKVIPSGWAQNNYLGLLPGDGHVYERSHLLAHSLGGDEDEPNFVTGTYYLNTNMGIFEDKVSSHIEKYKVHVFYRVTPYFTGSNKLVSGIQLEAYSVEDDGALSFNVYLYNVQPGVDLDYTTGHNETSYTTYQADNELPFAIYGACASKPDLIFEMTKHLEVLFSDQKASSTYIAMMNQIKMIASEARSVDNTGSFSDQSYYKLRVCEVDFYSVLRSYVPLLLAKEDFFKSAFK